jgi:hypothetical protein
MGMGQEGTTARINMSDEERAQFEDTHKARPQAFRSSDTTYLEALRRRGLIRSGLGGDALGKRGDGKAGFEDLPPDIADFVMRDTNGRVRNARKGSTAGALTTALGGQSLLGEY